MITCPLCWVPARVDDHAAKHTRHYLCPNCCDVVIKYKAEVRVKAASQQVRDALAKEAASIAPGLVLFIDLVQPSIGTPSHLTSKPLLLADALKP